MTRASITDACRPTTVKERYIGRAQPRHPQQMMRVDFESPRTRARADRPDRFVADIARQVADCRHRSRSAITTRASARRAVMEASFAQARLKGIRGRSPTRFAARIIASITVAPPSRPIVSKPAWRREERFKPSKKPFRQRMSCEAARSGSGHHHSGQGRHVP